MIERTEQDIMKNWKGDNSTPLVSVCTITYNHETFIAEALDSFLMQETDFPFELVVDDDCSPDGTAEIIKKYREKYPNIINTRLRDENVGVIINHEENIQKAKGKYIAFCDGDDYWTDPLKLQKQVDFLEENSDYGLVCTDMTRYIQKEDKYIESGIFSSGGWAYEDLIQSRSQVWTLTVCFRKDLLIGIPKLDNSKYFTGDILLFFYIALQSKVKFLPEKTAVYRVLEESASHIKNKMKAIIFAYKSANTILYYLDNYPVSTKIHQTIFYKKMTVRFKFSVATGNYEVFKTVQLNLPPSPSIKMVLIYLLFILCKWKPFFMIFSFFYKKQIGSLK